MKRNIAGVLLVLGVLASATAAVRADVMITLEAFGSNGQPIAGAVAPGTDVVVDILLSVNAEDDPLADVRMIQFDFEATSPAIQLVSFTWAVDANGYSFQDAEFPLTNVTSILLGTGPELLALTTGSVKVASVEITVDGTGRLDLVYPENTDPNFGADIRAGFGLSEPSEEFTYTAGNLQGGTMDFSVSGDDGGSGGDPDGGGGDIPGIPQTNDHDGDGVYDELDAFPDNPHETTDTNGDGVGDNADPDDDSDGVVDEEDDLPLDSGETTDSNGDGVGDIEDPDDDGDNVSDDADAFPDDPDEAMDSDDDGIGNNADLDDDNDGVLDDDDSSPLDPIRGGDDEGEGNAGTSSQPSMCGAGMLGSSMLMLLGLGLMSYRPRRGY